MPSGKKFDAWRERLFSHPAFAATCSTEELYIDSYERCVFSFLFSLPRRSGFSWAWVDMRLIGLTLVKWRMRLILEEGFREVMVVD